MCNSVKHQTVYSARPPSPRLPAKSSNYSKTAPVLIQASAVSLDSVYNIYRVIMPLATKMA